jgi:CheY-like chemotaxis protein
MCHLEIHLEEIRMINNFQSSYATSMPRPIRVLHVDDDPTDLEITRIFLKRAAKSEFEISGVLSAEEALEKLERADFDVIIVDYKMPEMGGIEFLEAVRKSENHADPIPFILFTGKGGAEVAREALNKGADRYITKNGNSATQCSALARALYELVQEKKLRESAINAVNAECWGKV